MRTTLLAIPLVLLAAPALADGDESVPAFMERYERALDYGDIDQLREVYADWTPDRASALRRYFTRTVTEFNTEFEEVEVEYVARNRARVRFVRQDHFLDLISGERVQMQVELERDLIKRDGLWQVVGLN
jgi:hypothetical protein